MKTIDELIEKMAEKMVEAIKEAKCDERSSCSIFHEFDDGSCIEVESEDSCYYITFYPADVEKERREYPNLSEAIYNAMPDWDDVEIERHNDHINEVIYRFLLNIMDSINATDIANVLTPKVVEDIKENAGGDFGDCNIYKALTKVLKSALGMN